MTGESVALSFARGILSPADLENATASLEFLHNARRTHRCAYERTERAVLQICIPRRFAACAVDCEVFSGSGASLFSVTADWHGLRGAADVYRAQLGTLDRGLYFLRFRIQTPAGTLYGYRAGEGIALKPDDGELPNIQLSFSEFLYAPPTEQYGGIIYHIFVDRFAKGGKYPLRDGAILNPDWENGTPQFPPYPGAPLKNNMFFGGTLDGVRAKLDYLSKLGVTMIYLSPIFDSPSNHKYDTADYMKVDPMFGGDDALLRLIEAAKKKGIGILLDGVFNHTGADSIYFNKYSHYPTLGAYQSKSSPYYAWYDFQEHPDRYTCWWDIEIMPRIHPDLPECGDYFTGEHGVIRHYARMGVAGFRLDVADELSDAFIARIKAALREEAAGSILYGEVWEDASNKIAYGVRKHYYGGDELDGVMNYPVRVGLIDFLLRGETNALAYALGEVINNTPLPILNAQMNLLGTHDTERILTVLGGESRGERTNAELAISRMDGEKRAIAIQRLKMAYTVLATLPGIPSIYYGDEAGLEGYQDPFNRRPFPWRSIEASLLAHYRAIGKLRRKHAVYREGAFCLHRLTPTCLIFSRSCEDRLYLTVVNRADRPLALSFSTAAVDLLSKTHGSRFCLDANSASIYLSKTNSFLDLSE